MPTFDEVATFIREQTAHRGPLSEATTLQSDLRIYGDDMHELMEAYADRFGVDMDGYLWYFHSGEEGWGCIGSVLFPPPNARVEEIPITLGMLREFAEAGKWTLAYPPHNRPRSRPDVVIDMVVYLAVLGLMLLFGVRSCAF